jgi:hypothetical protein
MQTGTEKPRFREDLLAEAIDEQGAKYIDVMDPDSGSVFRFYEVEFSIACAMDGKRDVPGIVKWAQDELGVTPTANEIHTVIATLGDLGYLDRAAGAKAAAADVPARPARDTADLSPDTVVDVRPLGVPPSTRTPATAEKVPTRPVGGPVQPSEVSIDLSEHLAVGKEDVLEAVRQSRVMATVEAPPELIEPVAATPAPVQPVKAPEHPPVRPPPVERPVEVRQPERPVEVRQPERPVEVRQPERPVEVRQPERPVEVRQPERPVEVKPPVVLPPVPEKQPVPPPAPASRMKLVLVVVLILAILGGGTFFVWKFVLDKPSQDATSSVSPAPVTPQPPAPTPPPPEPPTTKWAAAKLEMTSGRPKTILAFFPGVIDWIEDSGKEAKSNDVIMKLQGYKPLEAQVAALKKETEKLQAELQAAYKARDEIAESDEAAKKKAQAKVDAAEKAYNTKSDQLLKKTDQLEPFYVRLVLDGTLTITRKVGEKIPENTPIATVVVPPAPSATFKLPPDVKVELGTTTALKLGERLITCEVADWEPEKLRIACEPGPGVVEGATVSWQLP